MAKKKSGSFRKIFCFALLAIIVAAYFVGLQRENQIDEKLGFRKIKDIHEVETFKAGENIAVGELKIHFIDVGQGDACLIELPDDKSVLIDAGENRNSVKTALSDYIEKVNDVREEAGREEISSFDYVIATHSDSDHIGSMPYILGLYPAQIFYRPNEKATYAGFTDPAINGQNKRNKFCEDGNGEKDTKTYKDAIEAGYKTAEGIVTNPADNTQNCITPDAGVSMDLYYEINFYGHSSPSYSDHNNYSPIIIIDYKGRRIALSGDCEKKGEEEFCLLANQKSDPRYNVFDGDFYVDIIKLGHHGSRTSSSEDYLGIMTAKFGSGSKEGVFAIISCGKDNSYGHPHTEILERLDKMKFLADNILRTDESGNIYFAVLFESGQADLVFEGDIFHPEDKPPVNPPPVDPPENPPENPPVWEYPHEILGITIRFRTLGIAVIIVFALILFPAAFLGGKKNRSAAKTARNVTNAGAAISSVAATNKKNDNQSIFENTLKAAKTVSKTKTPAKKKTTTAKKTTTTKKNTKK